MAKKKALTAESISDAYVKYALENQESPKSVYVFAQHNGFKESEFYQHFASFEAIESKFLENILSHSIALLHKDKAYAEFDAKNKLLSLYYTLFEMMKANRSFVLYILDKNKGLNTLKALSSFRKLFLDFISGIDIETMDLNVSSLEELKERTIGEGAYSQLLVTLKFWMDDTSPSFEKTDVFIEKSLNASFELINIKAFSSLIDFGKFIFKEKMQTNA
jgi:hypothetical protein